LSFLRKYYACSLTAERVVILLLLPNSRQKAILPLLLPGRGRQGEKLIFILATGGNLGNNFGKLKYFCGKYDKYYFIESVAYNWYSLPLSCGGGVCRNLKRD
jgi:hypothetical protein